jgi:heme-degrading monooxygenase HmoA
MISRIWTARTSATQAPLYQEHFARHVLPQLSTLEGYLGATLLTASEGDLVHICVMTRWQSPEAIKAFAGPDLTRAIVADEAAALLIDWDKRVRHYEVAVEVRM